MGKQGKGKPTTSGSVANKSTIDLCNNLEKCLLNFHGIYVPNFITDADRIEKEILKILKRKDNKESNSIPPSLTQNLKLVGSHYRNVIEKYEALEFYITSPFDMIAAYANEECVKYALEKYNIPWSHLLNSDNGGALVFWTSIYTSRTDKTLGEKYLNLIKIGLEYLKKNKINIYTIPLKYSTSFLGFAVEYERDLQDANFAITKYLLEQFPNPPQNLITQLFKQHRDNNSLRLIFPEFQSTQNNTSVSHTQTLETYYPATKLLTVDLSKCNTTNHSDEFLSFYDLHLSLADVFLETDVLLSNNCIVEAINRLAKYKPTFKLYFSNIVDSDIFTTHSLSDKKLDDLEMYFKQLKWSLVYNTKNTKIDCRVWAASPPQDVIGKLFNTLFSKYLELILSPQNNPSEHIHRMLQEGRDYAKIAIKLLKDKDNYKRVFNNAYIFYSLCKYHQFILSTDSISSKTLKIKLITTLESLFENADIDANPFMLKALLEISIGHLAEYCTKKKEWKDLRRLFEILKNAQDITCLKEKVTLNLPPECLDQLTSSEKKVALKLPSRCLDKLTDSARKYIKHLDNTNNLVEANDFQFLLPSLGISLSETRLENKEQHLKGLSEFLGESFNNAFTFKDNGNDLTVEVRYNPDTHDPSKFDEENKLGITINKDTQTFVVRDIYKHHINEFERFFNAWKNASTVSPESLEDKLKEPSLDDVEARLKALNLSSTGIYAFQPLKLLRPLDTGMKGSHTTSQTTTELMAKQKEENERHQKIIEAIKQIVPEGYDHLTMVETPDIPNLFCRNFYVIHSSVYPENGFLTRTEYTFGNHTIPAINQIASKGLNENGAKMFKKDKIDHIQLKHISLGDSRLIGKKGPTIQFDGIGEISLYLVNEVINHAEEKRKYRFK